MTLGFRFALSQVQATSTGTGNVQSAAAPANAINCILSAETNAVRFTLDGSTPTSANGHVLPTGAVPFYVPTGWQGTIKFCSTVAGNATLNITWVSE